MSKFLKWRLGQWAPLGLVALAALMLAPAAANATPYVVTLTQQGGNVVASGSGEFDLTGLSFYGNYTLANGMEPNYGYVGTGPEGVLMDGYTGATGPANFGSGGYTPATTGSGDGVAFNDGGFGFPLLFVPTGYVSGSALSDSSTYNGASFASLGVTPGTYTWTWGGGADQSFTLLINRAVAVPEPAALGLFGFGLLLIGAFAGLRRPTG